MAILEDRSRGKFLMFQIENNGSWYWEILEYDGFLVLNLTGPNETFSQWSKRLRPGETFVGVTAAICYSDSLNGVLGEMTRYRRHLLVGERPENRSLPTVYNEYMYGYWESSTERSTAALVPFIASLGIEYYVIDCGWHDEQDATFSYIGRWKESHRRFPSGIKKTVDLIHAHHMKAGLWMEMEAVGYLCEEMNRYYSKECFFVKNGEKVCAMGRYQLDFRHPKVRAYLSEIIRELVEDVGVDYLKIDYNQCSGAGTEIDSDSLGDGLLEHNRAYAAFIEEVLRKYPHLILESCASGGQRLDPETLRRCHLVSVSDQTDYRKFPYLAGNISAAVLPEQAAIWSYPVATDAAIGEIREASPEAIDKMIGEEQIVMNMVNSMLGRLHLASFLQLLPEEKLRLVREGLAFYQSIAAEKRESVPFLPLGYAGFGDPFVVTGLQCSERIYLSVWGLSDQQTVRIPLQEVGVTSVRVGYPTGLPTDYSFDGTTLTVHFVRANTARVFVCERAR